MRFEREGGGSNSDSQQLEKRRATWRRSKAVVARIWILPNLTTQECNFGETQCVRVCVCVFERRSNGKTDSFGGGGVGETPRRILAGVGLSIGKAG